ncbi:hypothetical protein GCM10027515_05250 [Schumannella luteola]|uniref:Putative nuclease of restriction endonuclease-like (RecB) superfamily n=1 Tax=Schumannella luteola TaxID=472059 RepID=A0A852YKS8_9MICO|nr:PDDEXK nuclease domain-containing protein [Schumannella luteola]NYG98339.1 putative nuclease of restriction endonuclease-like (RecB) superfamily [Schumannella luteola]TPX05762.1 DUF1016 domain-containing protein [Schumannella luteola]
MAEITPAPGWYPELLDSVAGRIETARQRTRLAANSDLVGAYFEIGRDILARQTEEGWGASVIDRLSADLTERFHGVTGFSPRNLRYMRTFAKEWTGGADGSILQAPLAELPWYHHIALLTKLDDRDSRLWYAAKAVDQGWSRDILVHHIESRLHEREGRAVTNFATTLAPADSELAQAFTRDPYVFDFLGMADVKLERDLENALLNHIEHFLLELGAGFAFVGRQKVLDVGGDEFRIDLLFYHLRLRRYVVIELKVGGFRPEHVGQLNFYLNVVDDQLRHPDDQPSIGILLCKSKNDIVVEYALRGVETPMGVAEWIAADGRALPAELAEYLPSAAALEAELRDPDDASTAAASTPQPDGETELADPASTLSTEEH